MTAARDKVFPGDRERWLAEACEGLDAAEAERVRREYDRH
jgi:hypothetical protein